MLELLGDKPDQTLRAAGVVIKIEMLLADASMTPVERRDPAAQYNKRALAELWTLTPDFSWMEYLTALGVPTVSGVNIGQSIADLGGITIAYEALKKSMEGKTRPANIDGFTPEQRFFIGWGMIWATSQRPESERQQTLSDNAPALTISRKRTAVQSAGVCRSLRLHCRRCDGAGRQSPVPGLVGLVFLCQTSNVECRMSNEVVKGPTDQTTQLGQLVVWSFDNCIRHLTLDV
jgi:hypothetical protein